MTPVVWVLVGLFVWFSSATVWQADIRLGYFGSQAECEAVGSQLDARARYSWEGMEAGPAWLRGWHCQREAGAGSWPTGAGPGSAPTAPGPDAAPTAPAPSASD